ncbi:hypothetical protein TSOC_014834, partial [Tetrabaena socialis]
MDAAKDASSPSTAQAATDAPTAGVQQPAAPAPEPPLPAPAPSHASARQSSPLDPGMQPQQAAPGTAPGTLGQQPPAQPKVLSVPVQPVSLWGRLRARASGLFSKSALPQQPPRASAAPRTNWKPSFFGGQALGVPVSRNGTRPRAQQQRGLEAESIKVVIARAILKQASQLPLPRRHELVAAAAQAPALAPVFQAGEQPVPAVADLDAQLQALCER